MRLKLFSLIGALLITMSASASAGTLVLETSKGEVRIALLETNSGFYNGIVFHRVIPGFMAQTGDPTGTGMGGSGQNLKAEFNNYQYQYGTVGMARAMSPDSADSQFFICFDGCTHLTGQYTAWGQVESGMEAVEAINVGEPPAEPDQIISARVEE